MKKHCSTISFGLKHRKDKKGKSPITMLISSNGERVEFQTGKKIELENWDNKKQQVKGKSEEGKVRAPEGNSSLFPLNSSLKSVAYQSFQPVRASP